MADFVFGLLRRINDAHAGKRCPGERRCSIIHPHLATGDETDHSEDSPAHVECPKCHLRDTKPGTEPVHLQAALSMGTRLAEKVKAGRRYTSDGDLTPEQWAALIGYQRGRERWEEVVDQRRREKQEELERKLATR